jgi:hypothetical protein
MADYIITISWDLQIILLAPRFFIFIFCYAKKDSPYSAERINEPVATKGSFVMNTEEEIEQAFADYKNGVFGSLKLLIMNQE